MPKLAITISPPYRDKYKCNANPNRMLYDDDRIQIKSIMTYNKIYNFIIYPELDDSGRLHYHGIINLTNTQYIRFHKHAIWKLRNIGFVLITIIKEFINNLRQVIYMSKHWGETKCILNVSYPIMIRRDKAYAKDLLAPLNALDMVFFPNSEAVVVVKN